MISKSKLSLKEQRIKRFSSQLLALLLLVTAAGCTLINGTNDDADTASANDEAKIYAAAIHQIYTVDHSFGQPGGSPGWPLVYVLTTTDDSAMTNTQGTTSQELPADLQAAISEELVDEPYELIWVQAFDEAPIDPANGQIAEGEGIIITLGNIHPQDDGSVQLPYFMTCGGLCGIGKTYVLNHIEGFWQVTGSVGPEIMS